MNDYILINKENPGSIHLPEQEKPLNSSKNDATLGEFWLILGGDKIFSANNLEYKLIRN